MLKTQLLKLIHCHERKLNLLLHLIGFTSIGLGIYQKSLTLVLLGALIQELGHFYQYYKTSQLKHSPLQCLKPQLIFAYPILILIIIYVTLS